MKQISLFLLASQVTYTTEYRQEISRVMCKMMTQHFSSIKGKMLFHLVWLQSLYRSLALIANAHMSHLAASWMSWLFMMWSAPEVWLWASRGYSRLIECFTTEVRPVSDWVFTAAPLIWSSLLFITLSIITNFRRPLGQFWWCTSTRSLTDTIFSTPLDQL